MEEEMARLAAEKEAVEADKKNLLRKLDKLQNDYVIDPVKHDWNFGEC